MNDVDKGMSDQVTLNEVVAQLQKLARGQAGYNFRQELRERYLNAFRVVNRTNNVPSVIYLNGWWEFSHNGCHDGRYRMANFIQMILLLEIEMYHLLVRLR